MWSVGVVLLSVVLAKTSAAAAAASSASSDSSSMRERDAALVLDKDGQTQYLNKNTTNPFRLLDMDFIEREMKTKKDRIRERRRKSRQLLQSMTPSVEKVPQDQLERIKERKLGWFSGGDSSAYSSSFLADPGQDYDKWAQAYRMLGGFIDCDHDKSEGSGSGDNNNNDDGGSACSRWMLWASYVDPNYQGGEYDEYFGDNPTGVLDCHNPDTQWQLLGVYRQEFYQFIEQISKHLWAIDDYEYVVALAGLAYMTDYDCFEVGYDNSGNTIYAGVAPQEYGKFEMALYTDEYCLTPDTSLGKTFDDFGLQSDIDLGSKDATDDDGYSWAYEWWYDSQEYTLTQLNEVYEEFTYCTSCIDYPTYQDGYFIGDYGTDDDDLINQCWKFYSHDSFTCEAECIAMAHAQGTILSITYGDTTFGQTVSGFYGGTYSSESSSTGGGGGESRFQRLLANAALTASFLLFVATFLAFAVARRSRYRESKSSRSRRLLDENDEGRSRRSRKSSSKSRHDSDGLFRSSRSSRSKPGVRKSRSKGRSSSKGSTKKSKRTKSYDPPKESTSPRTRSTSRHKEEYF